ncbi:MAG TPA: hypothetical protein EYQ64_14160 [Gemmatimonadetes bacterium]|nr:hypothetical protein [Gemmatimonadota bacterium]
MAKRPIVDRRAFLAGSAGAMGAAFFKGAPLDALASHVPLPVSQVWDTGRVRHLLPTVSDSRILLKASFEQALSDTPVLRVGARNFPGRMTDTGGKFWQFYATDLDAGVSHSLSLVAADGSSLCEPWPISTFPAADARPDRFRLLFFTCAGGPEGTYAGIGDRRGNLPTALRNRLLRRALSFNPDATVANGDHIYWDLHQWSGQLTGGLSPRGENSNFDFSGSVWSTNNEAALMLAAGPQIVPVYGTDFRSTPTFFLQDDHDHWENDAAGAFPVAWFQLQLARATQQLYYPEFLPEANRPLGLPFSSSSDRGDLSESFGTIRYGNLAEVLLYDVRRTMTLGPRAVFVDSNVEDWLLARTAAPGIRHVVHAPSNPMGWSAGKWGEWYPDILDTDAQTLTTDVPKQFWQDGWLRQHDRLVDAMSGMRDRAPLVISGDLHAVGAGTMRRAGSLDLSANPVTTVLSGPVGTSQRGFPSVVRGVGSTPSSHLDLEEIAPPIEQHGFTLVDFLPDRMSVRLFRWDVNSQPVEAIDRLEPYYTTELATR